MLAVALVVGLGIFADRKPAAEPPLRAAALTPGYGPADHTAELDRADGQVATWRRILAEAPGEWLRAEGLARALIARHRLTGDYRDLAEAQALIARGLMQAPDPAGPVLTGAALSLLLHRLPQGQALLDRFGRWAAPSEEERADALALAGDIAQQRGDIAGSLSAYARAAALAPSPGIEIRQAMLLARSGERDEAKRRLERLLARPRQAPRALAELALLRAQLAYAEGDWAAAAEWIAAADHTLPGSWLTQAYATQTLAIAGQRGEAARRLAAIAERSNSPEVMDALAHLLRLEGRRDESLSWWRKADDLWRERLALFPEAAALHAAEHALAGGDPARALALAQGEAQRRPHGATLAVLARALLVNGRPQAALAALDRAERQGWLGAGLLLMRAEAAAALGDAEASEAALARAEAINPRIADPAARLIWFGHD